MAKKKLVGLIGVCLVLASCALGQTDTPTPAATATPTAQPYFASAPFVALSQQGRPLVGGLVTITNANGGDVSGQIKGNLAGTMSYNYSVPASGIVQFFATPDNYLVTVSASGVTRQYYVGLTGGSGGGGGSGITSLNSLTAMSQTFATVDGASGSCPGTDFCISSSSSTHAFSLPNASAANRGVVSTGNQTFSGNKVFQDILEVEDSARVASDGTGSFEVGTSADPLLVFSATSDFVYFFTDTNPGPANFYVESGPGMSNLAEFNQTINGGIALKANGGNAGGIAFEAETVDGTAIAAFASGNGQVGDFLRNTDSASTSVVRIHRSAAADTQPILELNDAVANTAMYILLYKELGTNMSGFQGDGSMVATDPTGTGVAFGSIADVDTGLGFDAGRACLVDEGTVIACADQNGGSFPALEVGNSLVVTGSGALTSIGKFTSTAGASAADPLVLIQATNSAFADSLLTVENTAVSHGGTYLQDWQISSTPVSGVLATGGFTSIDPAGSNVAFSSLGDETSGLGFTAGSPCIYDDGACIVTVVNSSPDIVQVSGELVVTGVTGAGKVVCVKAGGELGVCADQPDVSGECTCG